MRIFQIVTLSELGGAQSVLVNLANTLSKEHEIIVIAGDGDGQLFQMLETGIKYRRINSLRRNISPINEVLTIFHFVYLYLKFKPDIIHLHSSKAGILGRIAFPKKKTVYTVHGFDSIRLAYKKYLPIERYMQNYCRMIIAVSQYDRDNLYSENITRNVKCIYNGIGHPRSSNRYKKNILCIARISKQKRFDIFLETAKILPQYAFLWIGNQEPVLNVPENVFCLGSIPNAGRYIQLADIFMLPTNYEGLPVVIIEAMGYGKPVVASNVGGVSEIVVNGENGYVVENDEKNFAKKIKYVLENDDVYESLSKKALKRFHVDLSVKNMVDKYMDIYNDECCGLNTIENVSDDKEYVVL